MPAAIPSRAPDCAAASALGAPIATSTIMIDRMSRAVITGFSLSIVGGERNESRATCVARLSNCRATPASARGLRHVLRGRSFLTLHEIELDGLPFSETLEA